MTAPRVVLVLGAAGLVGSFVAGDLLRRGHPVLALARRFTASQRATLGTSAREIPIVDLSAEELAGVLRDSGADIVVNCLGVLQDSPGANTQDVHEGFVERLIAALQAARRPILLVHVSIPGAEATDRTPFSRTKRKAEHRIATSGLNYAILRPSLVFAPAAFGGSALLRALAVLPINLPEEESRRAFSAVAVEDMAQTVAVLAQRWMPGENKHAATWDLVHPQGGSVGDVVEHLRAWLGGPRWRVRMPKFLLDLGAFASDLTAWLGWRPPIRSNALAELRRGVQGDPHPWMEATGIAPRSLEEVLRQRPATVQERWFARLFMLKALVIGGLVVFWCVSGLIALTVAYPAAVAILTTHAIPPGLAHVMTVLTSLMDISIGLAIAWRRTARAGLFAGIIVSLGYMAGAAILTPELWIEPLGALVKTGPAIVMMLVGLAILDDR